MTKDLDIIIAGGGYDYEPYQQQPQQKAINITLQNPPQESTTSILSYETIGVITAGMVASALIAWAWKRITGKRR